MPQEHEPPCTVRVLNRNAQVRFCFRLISPRRTVFATPQPAPIGAWIASNLSDRASLDPSWFESGYSPRYPRGLLLW
jgi:hypothetical protein